MTRQNYYKNHNRRRQQLLDESCIVEFVRQERVVQPALGGRKLLHMLRGEFRLAGISIGRDRFFSLLGRYELLIEKRSAGPRTTNSKHSFKVYGNLLKDITLTAPNQAFVSDITYIRTSEGFMYLA